MEDTEPPALAAAPRSKFSVPETIPCRKFDTCHWFDMKKSPPAVFESLQKVKQARSLSVNNSGWFDLRSPVTSEITLMLCRVDEKIRGEVPPEFPAENPKMRGLNTLNTS